MTHDNNGDRVACSCGAPLATEGKVFYLCATGQHVFVWHPDTGEEFIYILVENPLDVIEART